MAAALMFIGQAMSVVGTITQGQQAAMAGARNAAILRQQADANTRATIDRENQTRQRSGELLDAQRAAMLQNGLDPTSGTALIGVGQGMRDAEMDALTVRYEGLLKSRDLNIQAEQQIWQGKAARRQAYWSAFGQMAMASSKYIGGGQVLAPVETRTPIPIPGR